MVFLFDGYAKNWFKRYAFKLFGKVVVFKNMILLFN